MQKVSVENTSFYYFSQSEIPQQDSLPLLSNIPQDSIISFVRESNDVRLALFNSMLNAQRGNFYILYWNNGQDLIELDRKVIENRWNDDDFKFSVKTVYQNTMCDSCKHLWKTLIIPPGDPYPGAPKLLEQKILISKFKLCPACNASFRQMVVKVIGKV